MLKKASWIALLSSALLPFWAMCCHTLRLQRHESLIIGVAMMFSSTIVCIKLLPHKPFYIIKHTGELVVGLLLLQDMIAIRSIAGSL